MDAGVLLLIVPVEDWLEYYYRSLWLYYSLRLVVGAF